MRHGIGEHVRDRVRLMAGGERPWCPGLDGALSASTRHGLDSARTRPFSKIKPGCCFICGELCVGVERIAETRTGFSVGFARQSRNRIKGSEGSLGG